MNPQPMVEESAATDAQPIGGTSVQDRLELIYRLQREAIYPLNPVAGVWAQSQLAQIEVSWLLRSFEDALLRIANLEELAASQDEAGRSAA